MSIEVVFRCDLCKKTFPKEDIFGLNYEITPSSPQVIYPNEEEIHMNNFPIHICISCTEYIHHIHKEYRSRYRHSNTDTNTINQ